MTMQNDVERDVITMMREAAIQHAKHIILDDNYGKRLEIGSEFTLSILKDDRAEDMYEVFSEVLSEVCFLNLDALMEVFGDGKPLTVVYHAEHAPQDLVVTAEIEGTVGHFCIPSGLVRAIHRMEAGDFPPKLPKVPPEVSTSRMEEEECAIH